MTSPQRQREIELAYLKSEQHRENLKQLGLLKQPNDKDQKQEGQK